jgi:hypothetical protein
VTAVAIEAASSSLARDREWLAARESALAAAAQQLQTEVDRL